MKICYLANAASTHTKRWASAMLHKGCTVDIISLDNANLEGVNVFYVEPVKRERNRLPSDPKNLSYIARAYSIKSILKKIKPDIVHAHYATGYGFTGALCNYHPMVISTWGTDIFEAPRKNFIYKNIVKYNLKKADYITATSKALTEETRKYTDKNVYTIPFGIDTSKFFKNERLNSKTVTIGIVKSLEEVYGIKYLVEAFADVYKNHKNIELLIVGGGSLYEEIVSQCKMLGIYDKVKFTGKVDNTEVPKFINMMDIFVMPSLQESFGVAALEAEACGVPVIASDAGGIPEVVKDKITGFLVKPKDVSGIADKIDALISDRVLRESMGKSGIDFVRENYDWHKNVDEMYELYLKIYNKKV